MTKKLAPSKSKEVRKETSSKSILGPTNMRKSLDASLVAWLAATSELPLIQIIKTIMPWNDAERLLLDNGWLYSKCYAIIKFFYV